MVTFSYRLFDLGQFVLMGIAIGLGMVLFYSLRAEVDRWQIGIGLGLIALLVTHLLAIPPINAILVCSCLIALGYFIADWRNRSS